MPFILKKPNLKDKGVIVFKHSELDYVRVLDGSVIESLRMKFNLALYTGYFLKIRKITNFIDFLISADNLLCLKENSNIPRFPFNGFNFIDDSVIFKKKIEKNIDFLLVASSQPRKNILEFIFSLSEIANYNIDFKALIINRASPNLESRRYCEAIRNEIQSNPQLTGKLTYIELDNRSDSLPKDIMSYIYAQSKVLVCPSKIEGAARVVAEAVLNDCVIFSYEKMKGGTNNFLDLKHDYLFNDFSELNRIMMTYLNDRGLKNDHYEAENKNVYLEKLTRKKLFQFIAEKFYQGRDVDFYKDSLYNAFSCHKTTIPRRFCEPNSDEIFSSFRMLLFFEHLLNRKFSLQNKLLTLIKGEIIRIKVSTLTFLNSAYKWFFNGK